MLKKSLEVLGSIFMAMIIAIAGFVMWGNANGWEFDSVLSGSMEPTFNVGGLVVIRPVDAETLVVGDAISFNLPEIDTPICHRIIDIEEIDGETYLTMKGDANESADPDLVPLENVNGKAIMHIPYIGRLGELRRIGSETVTVFKVQLPVGTLVALGLGLAFFGLVVKELYTEFVNPEGRKRNDLRKKREERLAKQYKVFNIKRKSSMF